MSEPPGVGARLPTYIDPNLLRHYSLPVEAQRDAESILWQLYEAHPQITFAPTLYPIVAIFLHKHDQEHTYQTLCQLLQKNQRATRDRQFKRILMPTTRLEYVRDMIVLIKLCTKFGIFAPFLMRDLVREEKKFLASLERETSCMSSGTSGSGVSPLRKASSTNGTNYKANIRDSSRASGIKHKNGSSHNSHSLGNGNSPSHNNNNNSNNSNTDNNNTNGNSNANNNLAINNNGINEFDDEIDDENKYELPVFETPFFDWYKWIFVALPLAYCSRIVDCWLADGQKFLFQIALAMLFRYRQQCSGPSSFTSEKMFEFCSKLELILELRGGVEQLIKEAKSLKRITSVKIAKASRKSESKANLIIESIMRRESQNLKLYNRGQKAIRIQQPREDMLSNIIISSRIAPRTVKSSIVDNFDLLDDLWQYIPERAAVKTVCVVFNSNNDGTSLQTFFSRVDPYDESIIIIRTIRNEVFGAYCSSSWSLRKTQAQSAAKKSYYFGNGETFLFTLQPKFEVYLWVGKTESSGQETMGRVEGVGENVGQPVNDGGLSVGGSSGGRRKSGQMKHRDSVTDSISTQLFMSATSQELIIGSGNGSFGLWLDADLTRGKTDHCRTFNNRPLCEEKDFTCKDVEVLAFT